MLRQNGGDVVSFRSCKYCILVSQRKFHVLELTLPYILKQMSMFVIQNISFVENNRML